VDLAAAWALEVWAVWAAVWDNPWRAAAECREALEAASRDNWERVAKAVPAERVERSP